MQAQSLLSSGTARRSIDPAGNEHGAVAVSVALLLSVLLAVMAFAIDTAYLYLKKDQYQNGVEAAALAAVRRLCDGDWEAVARRVAEANGIPDDSETLTVETGFYDELDEFSDNLGEYRDFSQEPPSGRFVNAVHVRLRQTLPSLTGMNDKATVAAEAVAYLRRLDIVSLGLTADDDSSEPKGFIHLGHDSIWEDTVFWANGDILYPKEISFKGRTYQVPTLDNCVLLVTGQVASSPVKVTTDMFGTPRYMEVLWDSATPQPIGQTIIVDEPLTEIRPVDATTLDYWRQRADIVYSSDDDGQDNVYYYRGACPQPLSGTKCHFIDPAGATAAKKVIFFDAKDSDDAVIIGLYENNALNIKHDPNGYTITGLTFVANCPIQIINLDSSAPPQELHIGGKGEDQTLIISSGNIEIYPGAGADIIFAGAVFHAGGDFIKYEEGSTDNLQHIRIIADGSIYGKRYTGNFYLTEPGMTSFKNNSQFGPPCPPGMSRLGLLQPSE